MLIDTHCHIESKKYNIQVLMNDILGSGIEKIIVSGYDTNSNKEAIMLAEQYPFVCASIGFHPESVKDITDDDYEVLKEELRHPKVVAVGEIGLDYHWNPETKYEQQIMFKKLLVIAEQFHKPVIIHSREALDDVYSILKYTHNKGVLHCFSGTLKNAKDFTDMGYLLGVGGVITFKNADNLRTIIKEIPLEYIVLETDSPYLAPEPFRGKQNSPLFLTYIAKQISEIKDISEKEVGNITSQNARQLFDL